MKSEVTFDVEFYASRPHVLCKRSFSQLSRLINVETGSYFRTWFRQSVKSINGTSVRERWCVSFVSWKSILKRKSNWFHKDPYNMVVGFAVVLVSLILLHIIKFVSNSLLFAFQLYPQEFFDLLFITLNTHSKYRMCNTVFYDSSNIFSWHYWSISVCQPKKIQSTE